MSKEDRYEPRFTMLGQALSSPYADGVGGGSWSGLWGTLESNFGDLIEGGIVLDKRPCASRDDFVRWVVSGPMRKSDLPLGTCQKLWTEPEPCSDARTCKGFDYVSTDLYLDLWRSLGAKIGRRTGNTIVWEDGTVSPIPKATERYPWQKTESSAAE